MSGDTDKEARDVSSNPVVLDRITPTRRPALHPVMYQRWRTLLFLHWPVPVDALRPLVPPSLEIDLYDGVAYIGLLPFAVEGARPAGVPDALGLSFLETNVRTYVHCGGSDPGVYFFSLDATSLLAVVGARVGLGLPYQHARMRMRREGTTVDYQVQRMSGTRPRLRVRYELGEYLGACEPGTLEHFLIERYLLHVQRGRTLWTTQVHHVPYPVQQATVLSLFDELILADGISEPRGLPPLVHFASGVNVEVFPPQIRPAPPSP
jgi:uncharacterized protein YqjF (DUF2071 family)